MLDPDARMALFFADYARGMTGLRDGPVKFIYEIDADRARLFDVSRDPDERVNIVGARGSQARGYQQLLRSWSAAQKQNLLLR